MLETLKHEWHDLNLTIPDLVEMLNLTLNGHRLNSTLWRTVNASTCFLPHANAKEINECGPRLRAKLKGKVKRGVSFWLPIDDHILQEITLYLSGDALPYLFLPPFPLAHRGAQTSGSAP